MVRADAAVARDAGDVDDLAVVEGCDRQEARESRKVPDKPLGPDLLAEVKPDIALEHGSPIVGDPDQGDGSHIEGGIEVKIVAELGRGQGMHGLVQCPAGEQVDAGRLELPRARSEQREIEPAILDVPVHFVEEIGQALNLVDHHPAPGRRGLDIGGEEGWISQVVLVAGLVEEIDARRIGKLRSRPGALADPADAEEKEALPGRPDQTRIGCSCHDPVIFRRNMTAYCQLGTGESITLRRRFLPTPRPPIRNQPISLRRCREVSCAPCGESMDFRPVGIFFVRNRVLAGSV